MTKEEITQHISRIIDNIAMINSTVGKTDYQSFVRNEQAKEAVYEYLQEIGQASSELYNNSEEARKLPVDTLMAFRNARYNQEAEIDHQMVFNLITGDLQEIADQLKNSDLFKNTWN
ncbi:HepT-like ribonuclease domain-containing protein [Marinigracilibium pacificum]|uniref:DUF86 domain-containing protein n=1 Tax=Marinigracilibium pacificum TaxID=2729599 RepID=A0A848IZQ0_9BACT|nr:HepT-like ribonuclease domain-containing protein [Marinigracilibium pacificum]NMM47469.1 hypothetical protein [Marinigracilibium pacificum]